MWEDEKPRTGMSKKRPTPEWHTSGSIVKESLEQIRQHKHKPKKIRMPEDIDTFLEGPKSISEDHQARTEEKKRKFVIKQEKEEYK